MPKKTLLVWRFVDKCVIISCGVCPENYFWIKSDERMRPMVFDLQKASMWKRISASLFDFILLAMATVGFALILSAAFGYDKYNTQLEEAYTKYETKYSIEFDISEEEYTGLSEEKKTSYDNAYAELVKDSGAVYAYNMVVNLSLVIVSLSILTAYLVLEFIIPLRLGNGQTLGKKIFGVGVMRVDGVKIVAPLLFIRTILGKFTIETMIPVLLCIMIVFNTIGIVGPIIIGLILLLNIVLMAVTNTNSAIHDVLAKTVTVDIASQMIFETEDELIEYKKKVSAEKAARQSYF